MMQKAVKIDTQALENMEAETVNSKEKETTEEIQSQHDPDPVPPLKQNDPVINQLVDPSPSLFPHVSVI
jgi:hypothetical protein